MKARSITIALLALSVWAPASSSQGVWAKKEWQQWSKDDCQKVLEDSPWGRKWYRTKVQQDRFGQPTGGDTRESEQQIFYIVQIRSALPVRQAVARQAQIQNKYDKLKPEDKKNMDASTDRYLAGHYEDVIVVHVLYGSNIQSYERELMRYWKSFPTGTVPQEAALTTSTGVKVQPVQFISPQNAALEFELIFPRMVNGEPLITPAVKSFSVEFKHPNVGNLESEQVSNNVTVEKYARVSVEFKTEKMVLNGVTIF
jgi:hypothetical protein